MDRRQFVAGVERYQLQSMTGTDAWDGKSLHIFFRRVSNLDQL
jgi:hypothetical protein